MKIGLLGGLSWHSTRIYYEHINSKVSTELGPLNSANIIINSINAEYVIDLLKKEKLDKLQAYLIFELKVLERAGATYIGIACNTVHYFFNCLQENASVPIINIVELIKEKVLINNFKKIGILASSFSLKKKLYCNTLELADVDVICPDVTETEKLNDVIMNLCTGKIFKKDKLFLKQLISNLFMKGADCVVLGCTELGLLLKKEVPANILDSAFIHAERLTDLYINSYKNYNSFEKYLLNQNAQIQVIGS